MLKNLSTWTSNSSLVLPHPTPFPCRPSSVHTTAAHSSPSSSALKFNARRAFSTPCRARRRAVRDEEDGDGDDEEFGYNEEMALLETYTQLIQNEILLVHAVVDEQQVQVVIFKGFSSCLSYKTSSDPSRSVIPAGALIQSIDRLKGPFDPSDVQYIERGLTFDEIKKRLHQK